MKMTCRINRPLFDEKYMNIIDCIIDDFNDLTIYNQRGEIASNKVTERKQYMREVLKNLHNSNIEYIRGEL